MGNNGDLASVPDQETSHFLSSLSTMSPASAWLGGSDADSEGDWTWADGAPWGYTNWRSSEPNGNPVEPNGNVIENYLAMNIDGSWNDLRVNSSINFFCQQGQGDMAIILNWHCLASVVMQLNINMYLLQEFL